MLFNTPPYINHIILLLQTAAHIIEQQKAQQIAPRMRARLTANHTDPPAHIMDLTAHSTNLSAPIMGLPVQHTRLSAHPTEANLADMSPQWPVLVPHLSSNHQADRPPMTESCPFPHHHLMRGKNSQRSQIWTHLPDICLAPQLPQRRVIQSLMTVLIFQRHCL